MVEDRPAFERVLAADPRSLDVRSTSRWTSLVRRRARRPIGPKRRPDGLRSADGRSCRTGSWASKNAARFVASRESRNRREGCHRRRLAASTPTWRASAAWTLRVDVGDSQRCVAEAVGAEVGAIRRGQPRLKTSTGTGPCALESFLGNTWGRVRLARRGLVRGTVFDV